MAADQQLTPDEIRNFVIAAHFNLDKVRALLTATPALLNVPHAWGENDFEDALGAASHVGNRAIAEYLLDQGAPLTIFAAAVLGRIADVAAFLKANPALVNGQGAHRIPLMFHAALSGDLALTELLLKAGCAQGYDDALHAAIAHGHADMVTWLLQHGATNLQVANYEGKSPLKKAVELGHTTIADFLRNQGALE